MARKIEYLSDKELKQARQIIVWLVWYEDRFGWGDDRDPASARNAARLVAGDDPAAAQARDRGGHGATARAAAHGARLLPAGPPEPRLAPGRPLGRGDR